MRTLLTVLFLTLTVTTAALAAGPQYALQVDGLACPFCSYGIEKRLTAVDGVESVEIDIEQGRAVVTMTEGGRLSEDQARQAVSDAGFTLAGFKEITAASGAADE